MTAARLQLEHSGRGLHMASYGAVCVALWQVKPTHSLFEIQRQQLGQVVKQHPGTAAFMCIIEPSSEPPDQELRSASTDMVAAHGTNLAAVACVIEGSGFRAAITRTVLTGIVLVQRNQVPFRFLEDVKAGALWLGSRIGRERVAGLHEAMADLRKRLAAPPAHATGAR
jgi:hypothetical protein